MSADFARGHAPSRLPNFLAKLGGVAVLFATSPRLELDSQWRAHAPFLIHLIYHLMAAARSDRAVFFGVRRGRSVLSFKEALFPVAN